MEILVDKVVDEVPIDVSWSILIIKTLNFWLYIDTNIYEGLF